MEQHATRYDGLSARLHATTDLNRLQHVDTTHYDPAGNVTFTTQRSLALDSPLSDRISYYAADRKLRAVEYRTYTDYNTLRGPYTRTFEDYRYDAFGRRILIRSRRFCQDAGEQCKISTMRRVVWNGEVELYEIQVPGGETDAVGTIENDLEPVKRQRPSPSVDPNPFYGRVAYTHGLKLDRPLSVTRINYVDLPYQGTHLVWTPFTIVPLWNWRGEMDMAFYAESGSTNCVAGTNRCVKLSLPLAWRPFGRHAKVDRFSFHGSLLDDRADFSGLGYKRNRYYDPVTGRFTQEDPIGLAGGLNLYGYAGGDPINYWDPFGLDPCRVQTAAGEAIVDDQVAQDFHDAMEEAVANGYTGNINGHFRTRAHQQRLFDSGETTTRPGGGAHEAGTAVDLDWNRVSPQQRTVLQAAMNRHGFAQTYSGRHHFEHQISRGQPAVQQRMARRGNEVAGAAGGVRNLPTCDVQRREKENQEGQQ
jgi:RHS repeat-associated protein